MTPENQPTEEEMRLIRDAEILDRAHTNLMQDLRSALATLAAQRKRIAELEKPEPKEVLRQLEEAKP